MSTNKRIIPIANFLASGLYTDIMHNKVSSCLPTDIKKFMYFNDMCDDLSLCVNEYNERKLTNNNVNNSHMSVIMKESSIISYIYDGDSLNKLFESKKKYVYKPIYCNIDSQLHLLMMIINIKKRSIYIFDSNNNLTLVNHIEYLLDSVIFNGQFKKNFQVIPVETWNNNNIILNKSKFGGGYCVIISLLISHYIQLTNKNLTTCVKIFNSLDEHTLLSTLNDYSIFYYYFIKN